VQTRFSGVSVYQQRFFEPDSDPLNHTTIAITYFWPPTALAIFTMAHSPLVHHAHLSSLHNPGVPSSLTGAIGHVFLISGVPMMCLPLF
jgi:hypothetical protein